MNDNNFINIEGREELIDINTLRQNIKKQIENELATDSKNDVQDISLSKFEFTYDFVKTITKKRKKLNLTQLQLSQLANVNRTTISKIESFQRLIVNLDVILKLLDALGLKLSIIEK